MSDLREAEIKQVSEALLSGQSLLVLGEPGSGRTTLGKQVRSQLEKRGWTVAMGNYSGNAKELLTELCEQLSVNTQTDDEKPKNKTAQQLRESLLERLQKPKTLLICDDAQRWSASLRYWLEDIWRAGGKLLLLAFQPQPKEIFGKLPIVELKPLNDADIREILRQEAETQGVTLSVTDLAALQSRAGNNPAIAKRVVREAALGLGEEKNAGHHRYIDGTPFLLVAATFLGVYRLAGLGMGDKSLYIMGGMLTLGSLALRSVLYAANRGGRRL